MTGGIYSNKDRNKKQRPSELQRVFHYDQADGICVQIRIQMEPEEGKLKRWRGENEDQGAIRSRVQIWGRRSQGLLGGVVVVVAGRVVVNKE